MSILQGSKLTLSNLSKWVCF